jgi:hypothetical protein
MAVDQQVCSDPARPSVLSSPHGARSFRAESDTRFRSGRVERQARAALAFALAVKSGIGHDRIAGRVGSAFGAMKADRFGRLGRESGRLIRRR